MSQQAEELTAAADAAVEVTDEPAARGPLRVLVAEDEALIRMDLVEMLREEGYEVVG
jgi:response regulator NasT